MASLWRRPDRQEANRLAAYWDTLVRQRPATPVPPEGTPPGLAATVRRLHGQEEADPSRPAFETHLLQSLLATYEREAPVAGTASPSRQTPAATWKQTATAIAIPVRRYAMPALEIALIVTLILASIAGIWLTTGRNEGSRLFAPPTGVTPSVPMYRGNPARTGVMDGPGIEGEPVVVSEFFIGPGGFGKPVLSGDTIYVSGGHEREGIFAIDIHTGDIRWGLTGATWNNSSPPLVIDKTLYAITLTGTMYALDTESSAELWRIEGLRLRYEIPLLVSDGVGYVAGENGYVYALGTATGTTIWQRQLPGDAVEFSAYDDGVIYLGTGKGQIHALDARDGTELWQADVNLASAPLDGLAVANGLVYVSASSPVRRADAGFALALDAITGEVVWRVDAEPRSGYTLLAVDEDAAYLAGPDRLGDITAVDARSGATIWTTTIESIVDGAPALVDGTLYMGSLDGVLHALDTSTGTESWRMDFESEFGSAPIVAGGLLYIGTLTGTLYVIGGSG